MKNLVLAWLVSSAAFTVAFVGWMIYWAMSDGAPVPSGGAILRLSLIALAAALIVQLVYGGLVYLILTRSGLWSIWTIAFVYLLPVFFIDYGIDTQREARGMIAWMVFACLVAGVSWFFARAEVRTETDLL
ncbi:hypothetical protein CWS35_25540 [Bradyrhizobium sp. SK17]|jgi:hypothetical protein|uniref:hypothetical protein n=1 Tax=Bradyrhizobium sp. SK17 TaxID=2057741 RepID=UPI000C307DFE|nr:hypothetical protein [Bradyrhizobium sp. SK17]AUC97233.1 hypothetical protein CWS35_25540 [Bradyrhizobium sp. SK17]